MNNTVYYTSWLLLIQINFEANNNNDNNNNNNKSLYKQVSSKLWDAKLIFFSQLLYNKEIS